LPIIGDPERAVPVEGEAFRLHSGRSQACPDVAAPIDEQQQMLAPADHEEHVQSRNQGESSEVLVPPKRNAIQDVSRTETIA
jgi:hypothetical protein